MNSKIIIIGKLSDSELELLKSETEKDNWDIETVDSAAEISHESLALAAGYISFLPCELELLYNLFAELPIGTNKYKSLFQAINSEDELTLLEELPISSFFTRPLTRLTVANFIGLISSQNTYSREHVGLMSEIVKYRKQKQQLLKVGTALSCNHDIDNLLELILDESMDIVRADAGSIYVRERDSTSKRFINSLRFKVAKNNSVKMPSMDEFTIEIDRNRIAGYVADTGSTLNIDDVYELDETVPYSFNKDIDTKFGYRVKSMITLPLLNMENKIVGILQLINKKKQFNTKLHSPNIVENEVMPFSYSDEEFLLSIASLAAVSIERTQLHEDIENILEGFLASSSAAIDERDKVTSGHSHRVMGYSVAFAEAVNLANSGSFADKYFSKDQLKEFKFAALLHDIGKIGVPEAVLNKENRLDTGILEAVISRFELEKNRLILNADDNRGDWDSPSEIDDAVRLIKEVNHAGFLDDERHEKLNHIINRKYVDFDNVIKPILSTEEGEALSVIKGNLTSKERVLINSHASSTYRILSKVPWTEDMKRLPEIAAHHHEKLDGSGYPDGLKSDRILFESKILAVIDIFDALVAQDRPYKPAMPLDKAMNILRFEVESNHLDGDIVEFFIESGLPYLFEKN